MQGVGKWVFQFSCCITVSSFKVRFRRTTHVKDEIKKWHDFWSQLCILSVLYARQRYISIYKVKWRPDPVKWLPNSPDLKSMDFSFVGFDKGRRVLSLPTTRAQDTDQKGQCTN